MAGAARERGFKSRHVGDGVGLNVVRCRAGHAPDGVGHGMLKTMSGGLADDNVAQGMLMTVWDYW